MDEKIKKSTVMDSKNAPQKAQILLLVKIVAPILVLILCWYFFVGESFSEKTQKQEMAHAKISRTSMKTYGANIESDKAYLSEVIHGNKKINSEFGKIQKQLATQRKEMEHTRQENTLLKNTYAKFVRQLQESQNGQQVQSNVSVGEPKPPALPRSQQFQKFDFSTLIEDSENIIPQATLIPCILVNAIHIPITTTGVSNHMVMLLQTRGETFMPSNKKGKLKNCRILAEVTPQASSNRIHGRATYLSCQMKINGKSKWVSKKIWGSVLGTDAGVGVPASRIVANKTDLAATALASMIAKFGELVGARADKFALFATNPVKRESLTERAKETGIRASLEGGGDRLSEYMLEMSKLSPPILYSPAGVKVDLLLMRSIDFSDLEKDEAAQEEETNGDA